MHSPPVVVRWLSGCSVLLDRAAADRRRFAHPDRGKLLWRRAKRVLKNLLEVAATSQPVDQISKAAIGHKKLGKAEGTNIGLFGGQLVLEKIIRGGEGPNRSAQLFVPVAQA